MNDLQRCELEILKELILVFDELDISWFLVCGSALGAVKYKGFIPWDDDIDVGMYREDYERFLLEGQKYLPEHLFVQNFQTDKRFPQIFSKVRNSNTTYIEKASKYLDINHGVYVDVFPLDGYPQNRKEKEFVERRKRIYKFLSECSFEMKRSQKAECVTRMLRILGVRKFNQRILSEYQKVISRYKTSDSEIICNHGNWQGKQEYAPNWHYGKGIETTFEGVRVRVPEKYDAYLTQKYGEWRKDLPENQKVGHHYCEICDLNKSYREYV